MKRRGILLLLTVASLGACCNQKTKTVQTATPEDEFAKGKLIANKPNFTGDAWLPMFVTVGDSMDYTISNVTFTPDVRNSWHSHPSGQVLFCTSVKGSYQEKGYSIQLLMPGDVVKIAPNVFHWHGATPDSEFTHIAVGTQISKGPTLWLDTVTDEEYNNFIQ
ncbi:cupin domain-containing protein [Bacteroides sp.]|uniref:cupin domain-containing protein n=1 Tax=Bacteroides sp. TaxID=29523 RepID=UPI002609C92B|nr:cupin domain-containing protein [Bacteroides sp.]MDD3036652.1 cupin domain-containing protein [Bacteroides sp.]